MIAYNKSWLDNLFIHREADKALRGSCISAEEARAIRERYPVGFYTPNVFARIGFFLLTTVIVLFAAGLLALLSLGAIERHWNILCIVVALLSYGALEYLVRDRHIFRAGADDALLFTSLIFLVTGLGDLLDLSQTGIALVVFVAGLYGSLRFANAVMSMVATLALLAFVFLLYSRLGAFAKASTPFLLILLCALLYLAVEKARRQERWKRYSDCLTMVSIVLLVCFYLAGNFFAVRETSNSLFGLHLREGEGIPGGWFFWCWTILVPPVYITFGILKKDVIRLRTGLLTGLIVFTVRYYYHMLPLETAMVAGGALLIGIAWALTRRLATPRYGFTHFPATDPHLMDKLQVESLVIAETFHPAMPAAPDPETGFRFGGGSGSGGGASGEF